MTLLKKKRGGVNLDKKQIKEIKIARKKLRKELKKIGVKDIKEFEVTASSRGLYFDSTNKLAGLFWAMHGKILFSLLGATALLLGAVFVASLISEMQGHFTINLSDSLDNSGFSLSDTEDFSNPTSRLYYDGEHSYTCISIADIEADLDLEAEGMQENLPYFIYTFYIRNEGEEAIDYEWELVKNSESQGLSQACWVMVFVDDQMMFYAAPGDDGNAETIPSIEDNSKGYLNAPMITYSSSPQEQYFVITETTIGEYYRVISVPFVNETTIAEGLVEGAELMDTHKYTILMWLEGDDPDCTDDIIGGHMGVEMQFDIATNDDEGEDLQLVEDEGIDMIQSWWNNFTSLFQ